jgi:hypothetical protein
LGDNVDNIKKKTGSLTDAIKEVDLEVNAEKSIIIIIYYYYYWWGSTESLGICSSP